jgi:GNAT superfamily N-acetyltransferase
VPAVSPTEALGYDRARHTVSVMCEHDPDERHIHVGPVGVEPGVQGLGVGAAMLGRIGDLLDAEGEVAWLETDKPENVVFYRRHGFDVAVEERRLGFPIWFMRRTPR